jgi:hypothetical protein
VADTLIPTDALATAHDAVDALVAKTPGKNADTMWLMCMNLVGKGLEPEQQRQNLALLLAVALQKLAQVSG